MNMAPRGLELEALSKSPRQTALPSPFQLVYSLPEKVLWDMLEHLAGKKT